eukprot:75705-Alexandrium_andersonii.AAC.1
MLRGQVGIHGGRGRGQPRRGLCFQPLCGIPSRPTCARAVDVQHVAPSLRNRAPGLPPCGPQRPRTGGG